MSYELSSLELVWLNQINGPRPGGVLCHYNILNDIDNKYQASSNSPDRFLPLPFVPHSTKKVLNYPSLPPLPSLPQCFIRRKSSGSSKEKKPKFPTFL